MTNIEQVIPNRESSASTLYTTASGSRELDANSDEAGNGFRTTFHQQMTVTNVPLIGNTVTVNQRTEQHTDAALIWRPTSVRITSLCADKDENGFRIVQLDLVAK